MTPENITSAINGAAVEFEGKTWTVNVGEIVPRAGGGYVVHTTIVGPYSLGGQLMLNASPLDARSLREAAVQNARRIIDGSLPPGASDLLL